MKLLQTALVLILAAASAAPVEAATFEKLTLPGTGQTAFGMNHDGSRMCGGFGTSIYLWENGVWTPIAECSPGNKLMRMSADGGTIIANVTDSLGINYPAIYREVDGWVPQVLDIPAEFQVCDFSRANGYSVSGDGTKVTGLLWDGCEAKCFLWTEATGIQDLGWTRGSRISDDGTVIGGFTHLPGEGTRRPAVWPITGDIGGAPVVLHHELDEGEVYDMTSDGTLMVGTAYPYGSPPEQLGYQAFVWQAGDTTITQLGTLSGSLYDISKATHVGDNGIILGHSGPSSTNITPFIWTVETGMVNMKQWLIDNGAEGLTSSTALLFAKEISSDGSVMVGEWADLYGGWGYYRAELTSLSPVAETPAAGANLTRVHPNPFNPMTTVEFSLQRSLRTKVAVYDLQGRRVAVLVDRVFGAGDHSVTWQGRDMAGRQMASGAYVIRMETEEGAEHRSVTLVK
jgi:hypothetical protein